MLGLRFTGCLSMENWTEPNCEWTGLDWVLCYDRRSVGQSVLEYSTHLGLTTRFLLSSETCGLVDVVRHLWRDDGSIVENCCCSRQGSHFRARVPLDSWPYFTVSDSRLSFRRVLRLTGLRWKYSTPPQHGNGLGRSRSRSRSLLPVTNRHAHSWHRVPLGNMAIYLFNVKTSVYPLSLILLIDKRGAVHGDWCSLTKPYSTWGYIIFSPGIE
jgi:hypothetical protein